MDPWSTLLFFMTETPGSCDITDHHNKDKLKRILDILTLVRDDTLSRHSDALRDIDSRIHRLQQKLNPLLQDRDKAKLNMGTENWVNNEHPKKTYAERRREMEEEVKALEIARIRIQPLFQDY
jgi:hypothetical protein